MKRITIIKKYLSRAAAMKLAASKRKEIKSSGSESNWQVVVAKAFEYSSPELRKEIGSPCAMDYIVVVLYNVEAVEVSIPVVTKKSNNMMKLNVVRQRAKLGSICPVIRMTPVEFFIKGDRFNSKFIYDSFSSKELIAFYQKQLRLQAA